MAPSTSSLSILVAAGVLLAAPAPTIADDIIIDEALLGGVVTNLTNGGQTFNSGDTIVVGDGITIRTDEAEGLLAIGVTDVFITNNGTIHTSGTMTFGNDASDPDGTDDVFANGPGYGDGLYATRADRLIFTNNGTVSIGDAGVYGSFVSNSEAVQLTNNGLIEIREDAAVLYTQGNPPITGMTAVASGGFRINAFEVLENSAGEFLGLVPKGGHILTNNGVIESHVLQTRGMYIDGAYFDTNPAGNTEDQWVSVDSMLINNGEIRMISSSPDTNGTLDVSGMRVEGHEATIWNNGLIRVAPQGFGIDINGYGGTIVNTGTIFVDNDNSHGIEHYRNTTLVRIADGNTGALLDNTQYSGDLRSTTANFGSIYVTGNNTHGVSLNAAQDHDFVNAGRIFSQSGYSIDIGATNGFNTVGGENNILLEDGSILYGDVGIRFREVFNSATNTVSREGSAHLTNFGLGDGLNATVRFDIEQSSTTTSNRVTTVGNGMPDEENVFSFHDSHVYDADNGLIYVADLDSYAQQDQAFWHLTSQMQDRLDAGFANQDSLQDRWVGLFGSALLAEAKGAAPAYNAYSAGVVAGTNDTPIGYFGGIAGSIVTGQEEVSYETRLATAFAGVSGKTPFGITYSIPAGLAINETKREVADNRVSGGIDADTATYPAIFIAPSLSIDGPVSGSSARLRFNAMWQGAHSFNFPGGTQLSVDDRFAGSVEARLQMASDIGFAQLTYGVDGIWSLGPQMEFDLMGVGRTSPYESGPSARGFTRLSGDFWHFDAAYDTEGRVTGGLGLSATF